MKFLVCGEALIDLIKHSDASWHAYNGGGAFNTAKALMNLGADVQYLCRISRDSFGQQLSRDILDCGISQDLMVFTDDPTSLAVVELSDQGIPSYSFYLDKTSNFNWSAKEIPNNFPDFDAIHIGTLALILEPGRSVLLNLIEDIRATNLVMVDLNARPTVVSESKDYSSLLAPWLSLANVIKVSDEDMDFLYPDNGTQERINSLFEHPNIGLIAITHGSLGSTLITRSVTERQIAPKVEVKDTVGAGDIFGAALLMKLIEIGTTADNLNQIPKDQLSAVLKFANVAAALSCTKSSAQSPTLSQISDVNG
ncbi:MAG: carbohydrate kinase [Actinobacteria bacterium]|nr:carbohydrate kinase [Actinomycetota bacterium]